METLCEYRGFFLDRKGVLDYNRMDIEWANPQWSILMLLGRSRERNAEIALRNNRKYLAWKYKECTYYE